MVGVGSWLEYRRLKRMRRRMTGDGSSGIGRQISLLTVNGSAGVIPHHALEAYENFAMTTDSEIV